DYVGAYSAVARPWRPHIDAPYAPAEQHSKRDGRQSDQERNYTSAPPGGGAVANFGRLLQLRCEFDNRHDKLATIRIQDERTMMYTANTNRAGCQTYRSKPKPSATRRNAIVRSQAPTIISEIGAT